MKVNLESTLIDVEGHLEVAKGGMSFFEELLYECEENPEFAVFFKKHKRVSRKLQAIYTLLELSINSASKELETVFNNYKPRKSEEEK